MTCMFRNPNDNSKYHNVFSWPKSYRLNTLFYVSNNNKSNDSNYKDNFTCTAVTCVITRERISNISIILIKTYDQWRLHGRK